ncbi:YgjP-like metallopeptidase domain-containing protein [Mesonia aestuariivivens]|uniref:DUF45 domain-containing protein n=1 Tax=Mesonia aestuariivivens TaxID=2796128 RepID=A0ABS6VZT0_9FLAO|nr:DUF45 domain-containing protein [Mesonia aestuariivivens]
MCHFVVPNHNKDFYHILSLIMPNWRRWKNLLEVKLA